MNLAEVLVAGTVFVLSVTTSAQLWATSANWSRATEARRVMQQQLDLDLLRAERILARHGAAARGAELPPPCTPATEAQLRQWASSEPIELESGSASAAGSLWLVGRAASQPGAAAIERRRFFSGAAHGLCLPG